MFFLALGATVLLGVQVLWQRLEERHADLGGAALIWERNAALTQLPTALVLARDFTLERVPERVEARLLVDQEYLLYVNGDWVGGGRYRLGDPLDRYNVTDLLHPGPNRVAVLARSATGAGAVLLELADPAGGWSLVTDKSWSVFPQYLAGILEGTRPLQGGASPLVWGRPPIGRWTLSEPSAEQPRVPLEQPPIAPMPVARAVRVRLEKGTSGRWASSRPNSAAAGSNAENHAQWLDFGAPVTGYLELWADWSTPMTEIRIWSDDDEPEQEGVAAQSWVPEHTLDAIPWPGSGHWRSAVAKTFRYALILHHGTKAPAPLRGAALQPAAAGVVPRTPSPLPGPFGIERPEKDPALEEIELTSEQTLETRIESARGDKGP